MTDQMFNHTSFLAQALRQDTPRVVNNSGDTIYNLSHYSGNQQQSGNTSAFYTANQNNSEQTPPAYNHHSFNSENNDWKVENADVSALSLTEARTAGHITNDRLSNESVEIDSIEENTNNVRKKLIRTGQMERLNELVERRLSETGWRLDMVAVCRSIVKVRGSSITFEEIFQELRNSARARIPASVEEEIMQKIKECYESAIPCVD